ncbi:MAG: hypothetical protein ABFR36_01385 [Acidobacteriota bacterium]
MSPLRKVIGFIIAALIGIPVLFATILAVGVSNAVVTPEVMSDLPREIIAELPSTIDELYTALETDEIIDDEKTRIIVDSMKRTGIAPRKVMEESGIFEWMKVELSESIRQFGEVLRGERNPDPILLNMKPLKDAILHNSITSYMRSIVRNLPECRDIEVEEWKRIAFTNDWSDGFDLDEFPNCRPAGLEITDDLIKMFQLRAVEEMPEDVEILDDWVELPRGWNFTKIVSAVTYALFIFPALLIFLGALIAATSKASFFRWSGVATMTGGLLAYGLASLLENIIPVSEFSFRYDFSHAVSTRFEELVIMKIGNLTEMFVNSLFAPASKLGGTIAIIGLILFALSFLMNENRQSAE